MKPFVTVLFAGWILLGGLLPGFSIDQSVHLGDLVQHYQAHRRDNVDLTFVAFLDMHYGANSDHQKHPKHSHNKLPVSSHPIFVYTSGTVKLADFFPVHYWTSSAPTSFAWVNFYSFLVVSFLMNPPRV
ncbi:hypothetical protein [Spirosoma spitsbergense]|jgi:hypothetical protein|uniref:hypothetical protein n=1 Tax=Spirosoma spitsbergense TaxID=431554 RepID=UPI000382610F|nr:hypothetical protein [Spirosoma spitsbergense]